MSRTRLLAAFILAAPLLVSCIAHGGMVHP